ATGPGPGHPGARRDVGRHRQAARAPARGGGPALLGRPAPRRDRRPARLPARHRAHRPAPGPGPAARGDRAMTTATDHEDAVRAALARRAATLDPEVPPL